MKRIYNGVEVTYQNETDYNQSNVVYLITFPDGKYYVGSTTMKLSRRMVLHCVKALTYNKQYFISYAIRKYMKFDIKILDIETDKNKLRKLEEFYTIEYKSNEKEIGYNDSKGNLHSEETKLKISESEKDKVVSDETKLKLSESKGQPFFDDFNNQFRSTYHASEFYKCGHSTIRMLLKSGKQSKKLGTGFHY